jgi:serine/threonine-protein kinase
MMAGLGLGPALTLVAEGTDPEPVVLPRPSDGPDRSPTGRYEILGEIARGGMGAVLKGRDHELGRDLAVKVLLADHRDRPSMVRRFVEEAQIGGQLQHPAIVPVYDLGVLPDRRPFFAMKLVRGRTLAALLEARDGPEHDRPRLLGIFEQVCQAVAYAHAHGVIHRDLKPTNVMVGSFGEVQVMDWGLAKVLARDGTVEATGPAIGAVRDGRGTGTSRAGSVMGTPAYMAPEQARGEVDRLDERSDVFALGAILCEALTGRPPFAGRTRAEVLERAAAGDTAEALAALESSGADTELLGLARACLAAEPAGRPRDAGAVARSMTAYLAGVQERLRTAELARAEAQARAEEARKRFRLGVALAATVLITGAIGGAGWWRAARARQARDEAVARALVRARTLQQEALAAAPAAPDRWAAAQAAAGQAEEQLDAGAGPQLRREVEGLKQAIRAGEQEAGRDRRFLEEIQLARGEKSDAGFPDEVADAGYRAAFGGLGVDVDGRPIAESAATLRARPAEVTAAAAAALDDWARSRRNFARTALGRDWRRLVDLARAVDPDPTRDRLRASWAQQDRSRELATLRALASGADVAAMPEQTLGMLGGALADAGDPRAAVDLLRRAQALHPDDAWINRDLALAIQQVRPYEAGDAIRFLTAARTANPLLGLELGQALALGGRYEEAAEIERDMARRRPGEPGYLMALGVTLDHAGEFDGSRAAFEREVVVCREVLGRRGEDLPALFYLASALRWLDRPEEAVRAYRQVGRLLGGAEHPMLGAALIKAGRPDEAVAVLREIVRREPRDPEAQRWLGEALRAGGRPEEGVDHLREAVRLHPSDTSKHDQLGMALAAAGSLDEAIAAFEESLRINPRDALARCELGIALGGSGRPEAAITAFREVIRIQPRQRLAHYNLGFTLQSLGRLEEAISSYEEAIRVNPGLVESHEQLGLARRDLGQFARAVASFRRARDLRAVGPPALRARVERWLADCERLAALEPRLPAILAGGELPHDVPTRLALADYFLGRKLDGAATRCFRAAFAADSKLADDLDAGLRYNAACAAALAGTGRGRDAPADEPARDRLRGEAIAWLRDDLAALSRQLDAADPPAARRIAETLAHWLNDPDLVGLRDEGELSQRNEPERRSLRAFWSDFEAIRRKALDKAKPAR